MFYIYCLFRPWNGEPCYIGKGKNKRYLEHHKLGAKHYNTHLARIFIKAAKLGLEVPVVILQESLADEQALEYEITLIKVIGRNLNGGPLVNMTDGGDGTVNLPPEVIKRIAAKVSASMKGIVFTPQHCAAISAAKKGVAVGPMSLEQRAAIGNAHRGRTRSEQEREALRAGQRSMTEEAKALKSARITAALTGKRFTAEHRAAISLSQRNMSLDKREQKAAKLRAALTGRKLSLEDREKRRISVDAKAIATGYLAGNSVNQLASLHGVSNTVIEGRLREEGVKLRSRIEALRLRYA